ncbi:MAG: translation initiation factor IF-3 [Pirellulaceae bacterium]|nr:translation initiation factor IF-3 [Pirellulaceae bacterium]
MNDQISVSPIEVIDSDGQRLGVKRLAEALTTAQLQRLDLVMVNPDATPPVCRIMDYPKTSYEKKKRAGGARSRRSQLKQLQMGATIAKHDMAVRMNQARRFLSRGDRVKMNVLFHGREKAHPQRGLSMLFDLAEQLHDIATIDCPPRTESSRMVSMLLSPIKK